MKSQISFLALGLLCLAARSKAVVKQGVERNKGLPDATALVGQLFVYTIPPDAFNGEVKRYEARDAEGDALPPWLHWDSAKHQFLGVAASTDVGPHYLKVTAFGDFNNTHGVVASDIFAVTVRHETPSTNQRAPSPPTNHCAPSEPVITVALLIDVDLRQLQALQRAEILERTALAAGENVEDIRLVATEYEHSKKHESLMAGPGDTTEQSTAGTYVTWRVACGRTLSAATTEKVAEVEANAANGHFSAIIGHRLVQWRVTSGLPNSGKRRRRLDGLYSDAAAPVSGEMRDFYSTEDYVHPTRPSPTSVRPTVVILTPSPSPETTRRPRVTIRTKPPTIVYYKPSKATTERATTTTERTVLTDATTPSTLPPTRAPGDAAPRVAHSLSRFSCFRGIVCSLDIPRETFEDAEDGDTFNLQLKLELIGRENGPGPAAAVSRAFALDQTGRKMLGLSLHGGTFDYRLTATDVSGQIASTAFGIEVVEQFREPVEFNHEFRVTLKTDYDVFRKNASAQIEFVRRLSAYFGDDSGDLVTLRDIRKGSTVIAWSNNSLPTDQCTRRKVGSIKARMRGPNGGIRSEFQNSMGPEFPVSKVAVDFQGVCLEQLTTEGPTGETVESTSEPVGGGSMGITDELLISTILPILIIVLLLLITCIVACLLYRRSRQKKKRKAAKEAKSEFVQSKGRPVVFPEEMETDKEPTATTPMLIKGEQPPEQLRDTLTAVTTQHENPLYKPPPPLDVSSVNTGSPRPRHAAPLRREPPPYIAP